jgi:hypothetical protein
MCINYWNLNSATKKDHFPLPFIDEMLERLVKQSFLCFLDGYSGYHQIPIHPDDQSKTTITCPYRTYAYRRMSFGFCNAPTSFQRCMMSIFSIMIEKIMEVFMDDFFIYGKTFDHCLENLDKVLQRCQEKDLVRNWEMCHFMVREGIVLGHLVSQRGIEVDSVRDRSPGTCKGATRRENEVGLLLGFLYDPTRTLPCNPTRTPTL